uniref:Putative RNA-directed DNA polymerase (Reverse transcriptase) n=1 Tax=Davidia involucrata TaxID=16924 RepID=A0A5B7C0P6_DAVIN
MIFIILDKAYDSPPKSNKVDFRRKKLSHKTIYQNDKYDGSVTIARTTVGERSEFLITINLYHGSSLSPYLFALVMDELTNHIQDEVPCMLFTDDIVLIDED